jgi:hypothetical protein
MTRTGLFAGAVLAAAFALPASAQLGGALGGGGQVQVPGVSAGGSGSLTVDAAPVTNTARETAGQARTTARATADAAKAKAAKAKAEAEAAKPNVSASGNAAASGSASTNSNGASVSAGASAGGSASVY